MKKTKWFMTVMLGLVFLLVVGCNQQQGEDNQPPVSPHPKTEAQTVVLYFSDDQAMYLVPEERKIDYAKDNLPQAVIKELVKGPQAEELRPTLPQTTRLLSLEITGGTAYVNLSKEFERDYPGGTTGEGMALGSIVRSLTELENIQRVQFLLEGKKVEVLSKGHVDLSQPIRRGITLGNIEQLPDEMQSAQEAATQNKLSWRLDPLTTAKNEGPRRGLYTQGEYQLVSKKEKGEYSGTGEAVVKHTYKNTFYEITLIQPVKVGAGGIWAINSILPLGTKEEAITSFLENHFLAPNFDEGKVFSAYELLGEENFDHSSVVYIWALCQEYLRGKTGLEEKTGISIPLALSLFSADARHNEVVDFRAPEDGSYYQSSIKRIFPESIQEKIFARNGNVQDLQEQVENKVRDYFQ